jgi:hypothetical protein
MFSLAKTAATLLALYLSVDLTNALPTNKTSCRLPSSATLKFPENQTILADHVGTPSFIGLGVGIQNYTCSDAGNYTLVLASSICLHRMNGG